MSHHTRRGQRTHRFIPDNFTHELPITHYSAHKGLQLFSVFRSLLPVDTDRGEIEDGTGTGNDITSHPSVTDGIAQIPVVAVHLD